MVSDDSESDLGDASSAAADLAAVCAGVRSSPREPSCGSKGSKGDDNEASEAAAASTTLAASTGSEDSGNDAMDPDRWSLEVLALAERLARLASMTPGGDASPRAAPVACAAVATDLLGDDLRCAEVAPTRLRELRAEVAAAQAEADTDEAQALLLEASARKAERTIEERLEAERAIVEEYRAKVAKARNAEAAAAEEAESAAAAARKLSASLAAQTAALRVALGVEAKAAEMAEAKLAHLVSQRASTDSLPALQAKRQTLEGRVEQLQEACKQLSRIAEPLRAEVAALTCGGGSSRVEVLEARLVRLERECSDFQSSIDAEDAGMDASADKTAACAKEEAVAAGLLSAAKQQNLDLIAKLKAARAGRDSAAVEAQRLPAVVATERERRANIRSHHENVKEQLEWAKEDQAREQAEVDRREENVTTLEHELVEVEQVNVETRERRRKLDASIRELVLARRKAEQHEELLGWRLQKTLEQYDVKKRSDPFIKCLQSSAIGGVGTSFYNKRAGFSKQLKHLGIGGRRARDAPSDGETSTTGVDPDMSTVAGDESVSEHAF
jgi:hypothetical protein